MIKLNIIHDEIQPFWVATKQGWEKNTGTRVTIQNIDFMFCISLENAKPCITVMDFNSGTTVLKYYLNALDLIALNNEDETRYFYDNSIIPELEKIILINGIESLRTNLKAREREMENRYGKRAKILTK
ncbi:hypothetical protein FG335_14395 [Listeria monocytogenes]|nr:hypothetical protein [Listeria monocytogenes]